MARNDGNGRGKIVSKCPRTRGHIDMGHRPEVPLEDRANVAAAAVVAFILVRRRRRRHVSCATPAERGPSN
jgi:hypothetical protein